MTTTIDSDSLEGLKYFTLKEIILELPDASRFRQKIKLRLDLKERRLSVGQEPNSSKSEVVVPANSSSVVVRATDQWPKTKNFRIVNSAACTLQLKVEQTKRFGKISLLASQSVAFKASGEEIHHGSKCFGDDGRQYEYDLRPETPDMTSMKVKLRFDFITCDFEHVTQALNGAVKVLIEKESILDQLGLAGKMFETALEIAKPLSEFSTVSKVIVGGLQVICKRLQAQQSFSQSIKERLDEIQVFMQAFNGGGPSILGFVNLQQIIKDLFTHALDVISFIESHAKRGRKGQSQ